MTNHIGHYTGSEYFIAQGHELEISGHPDSWFVGNEKLGAMSPPLDQFNHAEIYIQITENDIADDIAESWAIDNQHRLSNFAYPE